MKTEHALDSIALVWAAPRRTPRRASSQLMTSQLKPYTTATSQYSQDTAVDLVM